MEANLSQTPFNGVTDIDTSPPQNCMSHTTNHTLVNTVCLNLFQTVRKIPKIANLYLKGLQIVTDT